MRLPRSVTSKIKDAITKAQVKRGVSPEASPILRGNAPVTFGPENPRYDEIQEYLRRNPTMYPEEAIPGTPAFNVIQGYESVPGVQINPYPINERGLSFTIATDPELQGQGLGTQALRNLTNLADQNQAFLDIYANPHEGVPLENLVNWYSRHGFVPLGPDPAGEGLERMYRPPSASQVDELRTFLDNPTQATPQQAGDAVNQLLQTGRGSEVTDPLFARAMEDRPYFLGSYDLPMDNANRMARADQYYPEEGYHFTHSSQDFSNPRVTGDGGFHYGTTEAAFDRSLMHGGEQPVYSMHENWGNPVLDDQSETVWRAIDSIRRHLRSQGQNPEDYTMLRSGEYVPGPSDEHAYYLDGYWLGRDYPSEVARRTRNPEGSRTIPLRVRSENPYTFYEDVGDWELDNVIDYLNNTGEASDAQLATRMQQAIEADPDALENDIIQEIFGEVGHDGIRYPNAYEGHSMDMSSATFDPTAVRSRLSALFDPRLRHLRNMSAGVAGAVALPYGLEPPQE